MISPQNLCVTPTVCAQGRSPEFILQVAKTADRLNMPKTLACCERHVAIDPARSMRTKAFWEQIPARSSLRIARGLNAAYEKFRAHAISKMDSLLDNCGGAYGMRTYKDQARSRLNSIELKLSVPLCKAFSEMAEPSPSQAEAGSSS